MLENDDYCYDDGAVPIRACIHYRFVRNIRVFCNWKIQTCYIFFLSNYLVGIIVLEISLHTIHFSIVNIVIVWLEVRCF